MLSEKEIEKRREILEIAKKSFGKNYIGGAYAKNNVIITLPSIVQLREIENFHQKIGAKHEDIELYTQDYDTPGQELKDQNNIYLNLKL